MNAFQDYKIEWNGTTHTIPSNQLLPVIAAVEEIITLQELFTTAAELRLPLVRLSRAFGVILRAAGADVSDETVYLEMFSEGDLQDKMLDAVNGLLGLMVPPEDMQAGAKAPGKCKAGASSRRKSTKPR
jgi:hypothetical protein